MESAFLIRCKITTIKRLLPGFITDFINIQMLVINSFFNLHIKYPENAGIPASRYNY